MEQQQKEKQSAGERPFFSRPAAAACSAVLCTLLWGSAFPAVKTGYELFRITSSVPDKLLFAGARFLAAGVLTLLALSFLQRRPALPQKGELPRMAALGLVQTAVQYFFFYIALSYSTGVKGSILNSAGTFLSILLAHFFFRDDRMTGQKAAGCLAGLAGIILVNLGPGGLGGFDPLGDGLMLGAALFFAAGSLMSKQFAKSCSPVSLSGWQLTIGGGILTAAGLLTGGTLAPSGPQAVLMLAYLAFLSAAAFALWTLLLKYNPVGKISIFNALTPVFGVLLSGIFLGEDFLHLKNLAALLLVCLGIVLVNAKKPARS